MQQHTLRLVPGVAADPCAAQIGLPVDRTALWGREDQKIAWGRDGREEGATGKRRDGEGRHTVTNDQPYQQDIDQPPHPLTPSPMHA